MFRCFYFVVAIVGRTKHLETEALKMSRLFTMFFENPVGVKSYTYNFYVDQGRCSSIARTPAHNKKNRPETVINSRDKTSRQLRLDISTFIKLVSELLSQLLSLAPNFKHNTDESPHESGIGHSIDMKIDSVNTRRILNSVFFCPMRYGAVITTRMLITPPRAGIIMWRRRKPFQRSVCGTHDRLPQKVPAVSQMIRIHLINVARTHTEIGFPYDPLGSFQRAWRLTAWDGWSDLQDSVSGERLIPPHVVRLRTG